MLIHALDDRPYDHCGVELQTAAKRRGYDARLFRLATEVKAPGYVFMRLDQRQPRLSTDREQYSALIGRDGLKFIQDPGQIHAYEDKLAQVAMWREFMPQTFALFTKNQALTLAAMTRYPMVSKSAIGSASHNVRLLKDEDSAVAEINQIFGPGMKVSLGVQKNYWLVQEFVPHDVTYRVTAVGAKRHIYQRFNFKDRPMAAPSAVIRTQPLPMGPLAERILEFSDRFFAAADTKWCAIDVLAHLGGGFRLLETALGWARGNDESGNAPFYGTKYSLLQQHELLLDEIEAGVFG